MIETRYCKKCVYPSIAVNLRLDDDNICSSCQASAKFHDIGEKFWKERREKFKEILNNVLKNNNSNFDCLIPVSGGKDSYYQIHIIAKEYNLKPLLVTYDGNNWLPEGI